ncbi:DNA-processing protein DprA [Inmirania thermothiophila]|uniref:DNA-processing protein DprA n=1 Tax=Inmirania thermothiophila TaxID=1750597 RepID=UPI000F462B7F|nr:DNA-processing protein DprA [Inmirania thermothiophila]
MRATEARVWIARTPGLSAAALAAALARAGGDAAAVTALPQAALAECGLADAAIAHLGRPDPDRIAADRAWLEADPARGLVLFGETAYPPLLAAIPDPPPALWLHGEATLLAAPQIAIVGSRNPTPGGRENAAAFARALVGAGLAVTSGLALGIDGAAHRGALAAGGATVAVCGTGLDRVYPASHRELAREIARRGLLVSEFPPGTPPRPHHFPRRNRIIAGLALGTLVVEAAARSGSLITARLAAEQGREVFAVPGSIHNPLARGCHALIRQGAKLVEEAADILEELGPLWAAAAAPQPPAADRPGTPTGRDPAYARLLAALADGPAGIDLLVERTGLTPEEVSSMLLVLELEGQVSSAPGGLYARRHGQEA